MTQKELGYVELEWTCKHCGTINPGMKRVCTNCGAPISQDDKFELPDQQELITDKAKLDEAKVRSCHPVPILQCAQSRRHEAMHPVRRRYRGRSCPAGRGSTRRI